MSSGSYLTLYRKRNQQASIGEFALIISKYIEQNKEHKWPREANVYDIPLILNPRIGITETDESQPNNFQYILTSDKSYLDELVSWRFDSTFTCLTNEFQLDGYTWKNSKYIIDAQTAEWMLQACNYLLSNMWSDEIEKVLDNRWINIFATGNDSCDYLKYKYRNNKKLLRDMTENANEDSNTVEQQLKQMKMALETFIKSERDIYPNGIELMLVYSVYC